jgi:hypothetical protein
MALSHSIEMKRAIDTSIRSDDKVALLDKAITLQGHLSTISKKILNNQIMAENFEKFLVIKGILINEGLYNQHLSDGVLGYLIDQIWRENFLSLHMSTIISTFLEIMCDTHSSAQIHNIYFIKDTLTKIYRIIRKYS